MPPAEAPMPTTGMPAPLRGGSGSTWLTFLLLLIGRAIPLSPVRRFPGRYFAAAQQLLHDLDVVLVVACPMFQMLSQRLAIVRAFVLCHAVRQRSTFLVR